MPTVHFENAPNPAVSLIVVGWKAAPSLLECLGSLARLQTELEFEVLIVLNEPVPALASAVSQHVSGASVQAFRFNLGFGGAVNYAASLARGEYVLLVNDDAVPEPGWLDPLVDTIERRKGCGLVSSTFLDMQGNVAEAGWTLWSDATTSSVPQELSRSSMTFERKVTYGSGGSLLVRKPLWDQLGGMDESYYPGYYEDLDFALRAKELGWETWYQPASRLKHEHSASTTRYFKEYVNSVNRRRFAERWKTVLEHSAEPGQMEEAVWRGMDCPTRILMLSDGGSSEAQLAARLERFPHLHVAWAGSRLERPPGQGAKWLSVRAVDDLKAHLASPGVTYDAVVAGGGLDTADSQAVADRLPDAAILSPSDFLSVSTETWASLIRSPAR